MSDAAIPLSDLRKLWRQAMWAWGSNSDGSATDLWRRYVQQEIARRTIAELRARIDAPAGTGVLTDEVRATIEAALKVLRNTRYVDLWYDDVDPNIRGEPVDKALAWLAAQEANDASK